MDTPSLFPPHLSTYNVSFKPYCARMLYNVNDKIKLENDS